MRTNLNFGPLHPFRIRPADSHAKRNGGALWNCHGCGFPWDVEREACCFCPDWFLELRGETDAPHGVFRRAMQTGMRTRFPESLHLAGRSQLMAEEADAAPACSSYIVVGSERHRCIGKVGHKGNHCSEAVETQPSDSPRVASFITWGDVRA